MQNSVKMVTKIELLNYVEYKYIFNKDLYIRRFLFHRILNPMLKNFRLFAKIKGRQIHTIAFRLRSAMTKVDFLVSIIIAEWGAHITLELSYTPMQKLSTRKLNHTIHGLTCLILELLMFPTYPR